MQMPGCEVTSSTYCGNSGAQHDSCKDSQIFPLSFQWITGTDGWFPSKRISLLWGFLKVGPLWKQGCYCVSHAFYQKPKYSSSRGHDAIPYHTDNELISHFCQVWVYLIIGYLKKKTPFFKNFFFYCRIIALQNFLVFCQNST